MKLRTFFLGTAALGTLVYLLTKKDNSVNGLGAIRSNQPPNGYRKKEADVKSFLFRFNFIPKFKFEDERTKNIETCLNLNFSPFKVQEIIKKLSYDDYSWSQGDEFNNGTELFIFHKIIRGTEIYIKLQINNNKFANCISFHD